MLDFYRHELPRPQHGANETVAVLDAPSLSVPAGHRHKVTAAKHSPRTVGRAVCVRLCDGYFFPLDNLRGDRNSAGEEAACASACPGAQTALYHLLPGSDDIASAAAPDGKPYSALRTAFRHTQAAVHACACQGGTENPYMALLRDMTLRPGDAIATPTGVEIFKGAAHWPYRRDDFLGLASARNVRRNVQALTAIENAIRFPQAVPAATTAAATPKRPSDSLKLVSADLAATR